MLMREGLKLSKQLYLPCADPESFVRGDSNLITFFSRWGIEDLNTAGR